MRVLNRENLLDIISGATLLGSGGGARLRMGYRLLRKYLAHLLVLSLPAPMRCVTAII
ncbi:MAG: hypothetical protein QW424_01775 [Candidatus Bathyarchaeia archaeon]